MSNAEFVSNGIEVLLPEIAEYEEIWETAKA
jgi:hypothetical protein